jgi:hypothetical protein
VCCYSEHVIRFQRRHQPFWQHRIWLDWASKTSTIIAHQPGVEPLPPLAVIIIRLCFAVKQLHINTDYFPYIAWISMQQHDRPKVSCGSETYFIGA